MHLTKVYRLFNFVTCSNLALVLGLSDHLSLQTSRMMTGHRNTKICENSPAPRPWITMKMGPFYCFIIFYFHFLMSYQIFHIYCPRHKPTVPPPPTSHYSRSPPPNCAKDWRQESSETPREDYSEAGIRKSRNEVLETSHLHKAPLSGTAGRWAAGRHTNNRSHPGN